MEDDEGFYRGERCGRDGCNSRKYRINADGQDECEHGHVHGLSRHLQEEDEDAYTGDLTGRKFRTEKEKQKKVGQVLKGKAAFEMFLLCYQLILQKMTWWVMNEKRLPKELESVVHDLWALRLQNLHSRLPEEAPLGTTQETTDDDETDVDYKFPGTPEFTTSLPREDEPSASFAIKSNSVPNLNQALATLHLAAHVLRAPVLLADWLRWVHSGSLLHQHADVELPRDMINRLPPEYLVHLRPWTELSAEVLQHEVRRLSLMYNKDFGIGFPALNVPPLLFRLVEDMALPLEVYYAARRLAAYMSLEFRYAPVTKTKIDVIDFPEIQLAACVVMVVKLFYNLDGVERISDDDLNPAAAYMDWDTWAHEMQEAEPLEYQEALQIMDHDILDLPDSKIDDYLDFFQQEFIQDNPVGKGRDEDFKKMMLGLFPLPETSARSRALYSKSAQKRKQEVANGMQVALRPSRIMGKDDKLYDIVQPGEQIVYHKSAQHLVGNWKTFYEALARITGVPLKLLVGAMVVMEEELRDLRAGKVRQGQKSVPAEVKAARAKERAEEKAKQDAKRAEKARIRAEKDARLQDKVFAWNSPGLTAGGWRKGFGRTGRRRSSTERSTSRPRGRPKKEHLSSKPVEEPKPKPPRKSFGWGGKAYTSQELVAPSDIASDVASTRSRRSASVVEYERYFGDSDAGMDGPHDETDPEASDVYMEDH